MDAPQINPTDIAVLVILLLSALLAFARGFVREVLSVAAWVGAALAAVWAFPHVEPIARQYIGMELAANAAAAIGVFLVVLVVLSVLFGRVSRGVRTSSLNAVDRSLGFLFGIARGALLVCLAYLLIAWVYPADEHPAWLRDARTRPVIQAGADQLRRLIPDQTRTSAQREAESAAQAAREQAARAIQEEALRRLSTPTTGRPGPAPIPDAPAPDSGYNQRDRSQLEGLFERNAEN
ncbi:CvpA family protein [Arenibaculum sp.]|uniref:CvpA family protein n=1 Tax=Arenibaculum sp. TaxID=2865862 RepID=UPI002E162C83|nr:CvpA family protein [Arenibaculum sp.]